MQVWPETVHYLWGSVLRRLTYPRPPIHSISAKTSQEGIKCAKELTVLGRFLKVS